MGQSRPVIFFSFLFPILLIYLLLQKQITRIVIGIRKKCLCLWLFRQIQYSYVPQLCFLEKPQLRGGVAAVMLKNWNLHKSFETGIQLRVAALAIELLLASSHLVRNCIDFTIDLLLHCNNFTFYIFLFQMLKNKDHSLSVGIYSFRFLFRYILLVFWVCCQLCERQSNASV